LSKTPSPQPFSRILTADATLAGWRTRALAEAELTKAVRRHLPRAIADRVHVTATTETTLMLATSTGTVAAVIRQRLPDILGELKREGCNFTEIKVRVQVKVDPPSASKSLKNQRESVDPAPLWRLAEGLSDGPLKTAVLRLARRI
jgi:hypothetical protein